MGAGAVLGQEAGLKRAGEAMGGHGGWGSTLRTLRGVEGAGGVRRSDRANAEPPPLRLGSRAAHSLGTPAWGRGPQPWCCGAQGQEGTACVWGGGWEPRAGGAEDSGDVGGHTTG